MKEAIAIRLADQLFVLDVEQLMDWAVYEPGDPGHEELMKLLQPGVIGSGVVAAIGKVPLDENGYVDVSALGEVEPVPPSGGKQRFAVEP
jgi:hypothetical protein